MATLGTRRSYQKRLLEAIGNNNPEELGRLAIDMMENIDRAYEAVGMRDGDEPDAETFEYNREEDRGRDDAYRRLEEEYRQRFAGQEERRDAASREEIPRSQPTMDDITIGINPYTGREETAIGAGVEPLISDDEIFGEER